MATIHIDVWSDVACPWCWVGKRHLEAAAAATEHSVDVRWRAFELNPGAARHTGADIDYVDRLARKYRTSSAGAQAMIDRMVETGRSAGLDFRFDRIKPTNTFDAHRLLHAAYERGVQDALKERLFAAYMHEGLVISDHAVLAELGAECGLDTDFALSVVTTDAHAEDVRGEEAAAADIGVSGVPFFLIAGRYGVSGAQPPDTLAQLLDRVVSEGHAAELETPKSTAPACDGDECAVD
jgi:predicted DsbA family dithiol-disulfide isomerase